MSLDSYGNVLTQPPRDNSGPSHCLSLGYSCVAFIFLPHVCDPNPFVRLFLDKPCLPLRPSFPRAVKSYEALRVQDRADPQGWRDWVSSICSAGTYYSNIHLRPLYLIRCGAVTMGQGAILKKDTMSLPSPVRPLRQ